MYNICIIYIYTVCLAGKIKIYLTFNDFEMSHSLPLILVKLFLTLFEIFLLMNLKS